MPFYEFECDDCGVVSSHLFRSTTRREDVRCKACNGKNLTKILSRIAVKRDLSSQLAGLDPKYDKMVDNALSSTKDADPYRFLDNATPLSAAED